MWRVCGQANVNDNKQIKKPLQPKETLIMLQRRDELKRTFHKKHHHESYTYERFTHEDHFSGDDEVTDRCEEGRDEDSPSDKMTQRTNYERLLLTPRLCIYGGFRHTARHIKVELESPF